MAELVDIDHSSLRYMIDIKNSILAKKPAHDDIFSKRFDVVHEIAESIVFKINDMK